MYDESLRLINMRRTSQLTMISCKGESFVAQNYQLTNRYPKQITALTQVYIYNENTRQKGTPDMEIMGERGHALTSFGWCLSLW